MPDEPFTPTPTGTRIRIRVQPRASHNRVEGTHGGRLKIRLTAPPVEGAANNALIAFLADLLDVPKRDITIVQGHRGREKVVEVEGLTPKEVRQKTLRGGP